MENEQLSRNWSMGCHLASLAMFLGVPFGNILGPLLIWLIKKDEILQVDEAGKEALNFQISVTIYLALAIVGAIISAITVVFIPIAVTLGILIPMILIFDVVMVIIASVKVSSGQSFQYPLTIRFIQ